MWFWSESLFFAEVQILCYAIPKRIQKRYGKESKQTILPRSLQNASNGNRKGTKEREIHRTPTLPRTQSPEPKTTTNPKEICLPPPPPPGQKRKEGRGKDSESCNPSKYATEQETKVRAREWKWRCFTNTMERRKPGTLL